MNIEVLIYIIPMLLIVFLYTKSQRKIETSSSAIKKEEFDAGLTEPASLHPIIDKSICLGCKSCIKACPEKNVLGLIDGKVELISPTHCIGHGACEAACPLGAITLVFGTETRGVDIPYVSPTFETNVKGVFIAGELGGMGLIRNAVEQGRQALESINKFLKTKTKQKDVLDIIIVGAGPAGFSASLGAIENKLNYLTLEQDSFGGTVAHFPRGKLVMTQPAILPIFGKTNFKETTKEELLEFWEKVKSETGVKISYHECVEKVEDKDGILHVKTNKGNYKTNSILLAIGRRGTPRTLGVPGEDKTKVAYRLIDPEQFKSHHVVVVGGGDSALEAATSIAEITDKKVIISYRSDAFGRAKQKNRDKVDALSAEGKLVVLLESNVKEILDKEIKIDHKGELLTFENDQVIICAGGILPTPFLKDIGINVETKHGTA
jgi:thioredoxin reductase/Pyruvate/2-oxoacid:ferredoxin oxidoreductase delta subunit